MASAASQPRFAAQPAVKSHSAPATVAQRQLVRSGAGGGASGSSESEISVFGSALQGWMAFADIVGEVSRELFDVLSAAGTVVQAAVESSSSQLAESMAYELRDMGLPSPVQHEMAETLEANLLPFDFKWALRHYNEAVEGLTNANRALLKKSPDRFVSSAVDVAMSIVSDNPVKAAAASQDLAMVTQSLSRSDGEWRMMAALEKPDLVPEHTSIWCLTPKRKWLGDAVVSREATYVGRYESTPMALVNSGPVASSGRDLNEERPSGYSATILGDGPRAYSYALQLQLAGRPGSRLMADLAEHREQLHAAATLVASAGSALASTAGGLPAALTGLLGGAATLAVDTVIARLAKALAATTFPSWVVLHTAILGPDGIPVSLVLIGSPERPLLRLFSATRESASGALQVTDDYEDRHLVQLWNRGRLIRGQSEPPKPFSYPRHIFEEVGVRGQPIVINDSPEVSNAVRVFVPHMAAPWNKRGRSPAYVSGIRIEVYWKELPAEGVGVTS